MGRHRSRSLTLLFSRNISACAIASPAPHDAGRPSKVRQGSCKGDCERYKALCDKWAAASKSASAKIRLALPENRTASTYSFNKGKKRDRDEFMFGVASAAAAGGDSSDDDFCAQKATALEAVKDASPTTGGVLPAE